MADTGLFKTLGNSGGGGLLTKAQGQLQTVIAACAKQHGTHMVSYGVLADAQLLPNGFVAKALGHKAQYLFLSVRETHIATPFDTQKRA
jgi:hypothetical protein